MTSNWKRWITLALCGIAGSAIYKLPYLRETYYDAMQQATGATNAELGFLMTAYGLVNFLLYLPGGWAADRFSARKLMTFSLISTGMHFGLLQPYLRFGPCVCELFVPWEPAKNKDAYTVTGFWVRD